MQAKESNTSELFYQEVVERLGDGADEKIRLFIQNGALMDVLCRIMGLLLERAIPFFAGLGNGLLVQDLLRHSTSEIAVASDPKDRIVLRSRGKEFTWRELDAAFQEVQDDPAYGSRVSSVVARRLGISVDSLRGCAKRVGIPHARLAHKTKQVSG